MGTNKRYADAIDARMDERVQQMIDRAPVERRRTWTPPWPPIHIAEGEWIIMRDSEREPAGVIRSVRLQRRGEERTFFRVVSWAPTSSGRTLIGYFGTLDEADEAIRFTPKYAGPEGGPAMSHSVTNLSNVPTS